MGKNKTNTASGNDQVAVQVGQVGSGKADKSTSGTGTGSGRTVNVVRGNAKVGRQVDEFHGDLHITF